MSSRKRPPQDAGPDLSAAIDPFYTNEDVAILHDIVLLAEELLPQLPERERLPTNALFAAYFDILSRIGINVDHDSRYARVLFRIGGLRGGGTIYEKFEEILSRMGIEIEFENHQEEEEDELFTNEGTQEDAQSFEQETQNLPRGRRRRNSESSAWDIVVPQQQLRRQSSIPSFDKTRATIGLENIPPEQDAPASGFPGAKASMPKQNIRTWLATSQEKSGREHVRSESRHVNLQIRRRSPSNTQDRLSRSESQSTESDDFQSRSEATAVTSLKGQQAWALRSASERNILNTASSSLMQVKASLILQHHLSFLAKQQLRHWRDKALQHRNANVSIDIIATEHDRNALLQLAIETWCNRLLEKRQIAETERFFAHLDRRSTRARDLYLLHKAFTHWRNCAYDEVERTSVARRHIIRNRTFNAWRDITAINELKVRRNVLRRFFSTWRRHRCIAHSDTVTAIQNYEYNLVERTYRLWVYNGWSIKAAIWFAVRTKQGLLNRWKSSLRGIQDNDYVAKEHVRSQLLWKTWEIWKARHLMISIQTEDAVAFRLRHVQISSLKKWRSETRVIPAKLALQTGIKSRLIQKTFQTWLYYARQERHAAAVDRLRMLREAWTTWRHKVRLQLLRSRAEERLAKDSIYRWLLAERSLLAKRNLDRALLWNSIQHWVLQGRSRQDACSIQGDLANRIADRNHLNLALTALYRQFEFQRLQEEGALVLYRTHTLKGLMLQWSKETQQLKHIQQWSRDAEFYFLASKILKRWKGATEAARREKRRVAYVQIRRVTKINLARGVLQNWYQQAKVISSLHQQAQELSRNKDLIEAVNAFNNWRSRAEKLVELGNVWQEKVLRNRFITWQNRASAFRDLDVEAIITHQERQQSQVIKRWSLLTLQLRSQWHYAAEIREKHTKRTFRKMFSYWLQRTLQKRPIVHAEDSERATSGALGATARAETWSDFGDANEVEEWAENLAEVSISTPIPGYLSTPSRRMERMTATAARFSSTTPRAPLSTPFERHLRAQFPGGITSTRIPPRRSRSGLAEGFTNIPR